MDRDIRIAIIGGGAAGLTTAWFLKARGYKNVTVLERDDRIGGKCKSVTFKGRSFDLGANYITSSYTQVRKLAKHFGMGMFTEAKGNAYDLERATIGSLLAATTRQYGLLRVGWSSLRFLFIRQRLRKFLAPKSPGFSGISEHPELCKSFHDWLKDNRLEPLEPVFNVPITLMGYDKLRQIPAVYALTYMNIWTFLNLMLFAVNFPFRGWPKRFYLGYERLMERLAAQVDVLRGAKISKIERGKTIKIHYTIPAMHLTENQPDSHVDEFDKMILACPLTDESLTSFMKPSSAEKKLFEKVLLDPFVVTTYPTSCVVDVSAVTFMMPRPSKLGEPYVITQQFRDVPLLSIYSRIDRAGKVTKADVMRNNRKLLKKLNATDAGVEHYTYDEFPYFPHVSIEDMKDGFYDQLEDQQGKDNTYYVGGLLAFELVETITEYSNAFVAKHFGDLA